MFASQTKMNSNLDATIELLKSQGYSVNNWYAKNKENEEVKKMFRENALNYYYENKDKVKEYQNKMWKCEKCGYECKISLKQYHRKVCNKQEIVQSITPNEKKMVQCEFCNKSILKTSMPNHKKKCNADNPMKKKHMI